jgi:thiamine-monophosphate kinase
LYVFNALVSTAFSVVSEFEFIEGIKSKYGAGHIGDDCAVLPKDAETDLLVTADLLVEDIDFRLEWTTPELLGHKALAVSLSDVAAMGGTPKWAMLSVGVPGPVWKSDFLDRFYKGWFELAGQFSVELIGGDVSRSPDRLVIDSIVGGEVPKGMAVLRSGASPGDHIFITGTIGGSAGGLKLLEKGLALPPKSEMDPSHLLARHFKPQPQVYSAKLLNHLDIATSMIDVSDGLSSDLQHICRASHVGAVIYADRLPIDPDLERHFPAAECITLALDGGEDFELLFTVSKKNISRIDPGPFRHIGEVTANDGIIELISDGQTAILPQKGYRHF